MWSRSAVTVAVVLLYGGCRPPEPPVSHFIQQTLHADRTASNETVWNEVREFYANRSYEPAWVHDGERWKIDDALRVVRSAADHGLGPSDYGADELASVVQRTGESEEQRSNSDELAQIDVRVTRYLLALGRDVALGRTSPDALDPRWKARRNAPDFVARLTEAAAGDLAGWLPSVQPRHPEYAALQKALASLRAQQGGDPDDRSPLLALNLERWRWMPDDFGPRHIIVNVPAFHLVARENGNVVLDMKVVVGEADDERKTPIFSGEMSTIVFSPYWNIPDSIVEGETAPAAARDPSFLERNNLEILRRSKDGLQPVDPSTIDWEDQDELEPLAFRQRPGPQNALGHVKFLFPNPFSVYLHDTPADSLFARAGRAFSHGCVRVEQPEALAQYVLRDAPEWDDARIRKAMLAGIEKHVALEQKIPVHIVYFTAWPTGDAGYEPRPDVYGYDAKQWELMAQGRPLAPSSTE